MDDKTLKILVSNEIMKVLDKYNSLYPNYQISIEDLTVNFKLKGRCAGRGGYHNSKGIIKINLILAKENLLDYFNQVIPHEIAHIFQRKIYPYSKPHGSEWKTIMIKGGYKPVRCHNYDTTTACQSRQPLRRYNYECKCDRVHIVSQIKHTRMLNGIHYICKRCKTRLYPV